VVSFGGVGFEPLAEEVLAVAVHVGWIPLAGFMGTW
jgi:hypothetical protein